MIKSALKSLFKGLRIWNIKYATPSLIAKKAGNFTAQVQRFVEQRDVDLKAVFVPFKSSLACCRVFSEFELCRRRLGKIIQRGGTLLTIGKISGVLKVTSKTSLSPSVRLVYPDMTSLGTPLSSSSVNTTTP